MIHLAVISSLLCAAVALVTTINTHIKFDRHLFAWVSGAFAMKAAFAISGQMDDLTQRYIWDVFMSCLFIAFGLISMSRNSRCRIF